ncbi:MAG TPA: EAL domain-containing protein [Ideonella sp.]|nr:EAL domain-containing protein [Ideonella sp.]
MPASVTAPTYAPLTLRGVRGLIEHHTLQAHFQPIVDLRSGAIFGHEALIRGPVGSPLAMPDALFAAAQQEGLGVRLEIECVSRALSAWAAQRAGGGKLLLNLSATALVSALQQRSVEQMLAEAGEGVAAASIVIELTEHERVLDHDALVHAAAQLRRHGIEIALDDFGDGRSSLRLWSELKPKLVKIDKYFARDLARNGDKLQTWRALLQIGETFGAELVAEGLEHEDELRLLRDLGVAYGQGWAIGRPAPEVASAPLPRARQVLASQDIAVFPELKRASNGGFTAARLLLPVAPVGPEATHDEVYALLRAQESLHSVPVVEHGRPVGLIARAPFIARYAQPYFRELYGKRPCTLFASLGPLTVDLHTGIEELTSVLTSGDQRYLTDGFVITEAGRYAGLGTGEQLVRAVTEARIEAARHANPLTFLPGNIPISDHIERLLASGRDFVAAYADLNHFKPFNDQYGYWRGDGMIRLLARVIAAQCDPRRDFLGHVGGDDFVVLFQSSDWAERCQRIVDTFNLKARELFDAEALQAGGILAEDRHGDLRFHPCTTLCIGAVQVQPGRCGNAEDVASAAAAAKRQAKHAGLGLVVLDAPERAEPEPVPR